MQTKWAGARGMKVEGRRRGGMVRSESGKKTSSSVRIGSAVDPRNRDPAGPIPPRARPPQRRQAVQKKTSSLLAG